MSDARGYRDWRPGGERTTLDGITFDSTVHCGAGWDFQQAGPDHFRFRARCGLAPYSWRAHFTIQTDRVGREITLEVADFNHFGQELWQEQATVNSEDGENWAKLGTHRIEIVPWTPTGRAQEDASIDDGRHPPYGVQYRLRLSQQTTWFASPTPYTLAHSQAHQEALAARCDFFHVTEIGRTHYSEDHGHPILMTTVSRPGSNNGKIRVVVLAGEHPAESAGMYACEGLMEEILRSVDILADFSFWIIPVVNVDGVAYGRTYHNVDPDNPIAPGVNVARDWADRSQPETRAVWEIIEDVRPHCVINLHNGRHRREYEVCCPPQADLGTMLRRLREELPVPLEHWRQYSDEGALATVALKRGVADIAFCFETLLLRKPAGCPSFTESYRRTGMHIIRGLVRGLKEIYGKPQMLALSETLTTQPVRCEAERFAARLPGFYHDEGDSWESLRDHDILNVEVNGLPLQAGHYDVWLGLRAGVEALDVRRDAGAWQTLRPQNGWALLPSVPVPARMVCLDIRAHEGALPVETLVIAPEGTPLERAESDAAPFERYTRDTLAGEKAHLRDWAPFHARLMADAFGTDDLQAMFDEIVDWVAGRQLLDEGDPHFGGIWSEEDKYDARDAAAAAACFSRKHKRTGHAIWLDRALAARAYAYKSQMHETGNAARDGGFVHMVNGIWGTHFSRLEPPYPGIDGVDTCVIVHQLCLAAEYGLPMDAEDISRLRQAIQWVANNEPLPGVFLHHEGATHDCQNANALGIGALVRGYEALQAHAGGPRADWLRAAGRGLKHYMSGQEAIGVWPYIFASVGRRGQAFHFDNVPDHGIGLFHLTRGWRLPPLRIDPEAEVICPSRPDQLSDDDWTSARTGGLLSRALKRAARWYLCVSRVDGDTIDLEYDTNPELGNDICFSGFTWCRFTAAATLLRIAVMTGEVEPWRHLALRLMEHVRASRWQTEDASRAPVVAHARPEAKLATWCQAAEWDASMIGEMIDDLELLDRQSRAPQPGGLLSSDGAPW